MQEFVGDEEQPLLRLRLDVGVVPILGLVAPGAEYLYQPKRFFYSERTVSGAKLPMEISDDFFQKIRNLNVNSHKVTCDYKPWKKQFLEDGNLRDQIELIETSLGGGFGRSDLVRLYANENIAITSKFIAAMIWGYEAPEGGKRDNRGPYRVQKMFQSRDSIDTIQNVSIETEGDILNAYYNLARKIDQCGTSFITKHLYFLGKSRNVKDYPVIFDARVARGIVKASTYNDNCLELVQINTNKKAYGGYLKYVKDQAKIIQCELDQLEYFFFLKGSNEKKHPQ